ncbi:hypothetical protein RIF29_29745 [Crotalaria pallida]|uniref:Uncharacterized protein n=1 Tax=Crotalaria pallida TaxID=3830 RepID=A0AAN9EF43_CROPI
MNLPWWPAVEECGWSVNALLTKSGVLRRSSSASCGGGRFFVEPVSMELRFVPAVELRWRTVAASEFFSSCLVRWRSGASWVGRMKNETVENEMKKKKPYVENEMEMKGAAKCCDFGNMQ